MFIENENKLEWELDGISFYTNSFWYDGDYAHFNISLLTEDNTVSAYFHHGYDRTEIARLIDSNEIIDFCDNYYNQILSEK